MRIKGQNKKLAHYFCVCTLDEGIEANKLIWAMARKRSMTTTHVEERKGVRTKKNQTSPVESGAGANQRHQAWANQISILPNGQTGQLANKTTNDTACVTGKVMVHFGNIFHLRQQCIIRESKNRMCGIEVNVSRQ